MSFLSSLFGGSSQTSSTPTLTGQGQSLYSQLNQFGSNILANPSAGLQPITNAGMEQINNSYGNIPQEISTSMASRGYGSSGNMGNQMYQTQLARLGAQGQFQGQMANLASQRQMQAGGLMGSLLNTQVGSSSTTNTQSLAPLFSSLGTMLMMGGLGSFSGGGSGVSPALQEAADT